MARFFPPEPPRGIEHSELKTWEALRALDDRWSVHHSVKWQSLRRGRQGDGEADFVLVHPAFGVVVLEVKGGRIEVEDGQWHSISYQGFRNAIKNPFDQATTSKYTLLKRLKDLSPPLTNVPSVCHGVVFPDADITSGIGMFGPRPIVITESDLLDSPTAMRRLVSHWNASGGLTIDDIRSINLLLAPTVVIRSSLGAKVARAERELLVLTQQQIAAVAMMRSVRRAVFFGGPGTGKTVLAVDRARALAEQGASVLLTCFNEPLARRLRSETEDLPNIKASTFHSLCFEVARKAGISIPDDPGDAWWTDGAAEVLLEAGTLTELRFDGLIVDEAQDFHPDWFASLACLLSEPEEAFTYYFADRQQALYRKDWELPLEVLPFELDLNCRSTLPIVKHISRMYGESFGCLGAEGPEPTFFSEPSEDDWLDRVQDLVARLTGEEGVPPGQIVVLCTRLEHVRRLRERYAGDVALIEPGKVGVTTETIHRFKGLESEIVVLVLGDLDLNDAANRSLAYVGMSRARSGLCVIGTKAVRGSLPWAAS